MTEANIRTLKLAMAASLAADLHPADPRLMVVQNITYSIVHSVDKDQQLVRPSQAVCLPITKVSCSRKHAVVLMPCVQQLLEIGS